MDGNARLLRGVPVVAALVAATLAAAPAASAADAPRPGHLPPIFGLAFETAARKLQDPACLGVLSDFRDAQGNPLDANLAATGMGATELLRALRFVDGSGLGACRRPGIAAFTETGSRVVFVCPGELAAWARGKGVRSAADLLIHEELHALGLGENPPTSEEITRAVGRRCNV